MFARRSTQVEIEFEILKEPLGQKISKCNEKRLTELIQKDWKGSNILVTGLPGIGKTLFCEKLAQLTKSQQVNVHKYENVEELRKNGRRHFYSHENHEFYILVDNVTSSQLHEQIIENTPNVTAVIFSRTLSVENYDCVVKIKGAQKLSLSLRDNISSWNNHIDVLCSIPFLLVLFTLLNKNVPRHDVYFLLFATYVNYCQTSQVSLFHNIGEVPVKVKKFIKDLADVAYTCTSKSSSKCIDGHRLWKICGVGADEVGVVIQTNGRWEFTFEGSIDCLTAFKLFWINEEQFDRDTHPGNIKVPHEAMKLYKGVQYLLGNMI